MKLIAPLILAAASALALSAVAQEAHPAAAPAAAAKPDLAKGEATFAVCAGCHGMDGNSPAPTYPKLAQQHPQYIIKQLQEFKSGKRASPVMQGFATALSDDDMKNVAYFITNKKAAAGASADKTLVTLGERIYRGGIADRKIAACAGCHSPNGAGIPAQYPRLAGQWGDYVVAQLTAFRDGARGNSTQMAQIAAKMNDKEIKAVADYIAGLR
ncbi:c-type cytochrome [Curvibacter sp. APW13]|uniref:c-type cytochrome n=1 Tax=Curvibacter sp. APW13 TaxID=3077236 RepID=UPI0028DFA80C|nr:c-type cytochrome [Curvibacter sp. APW13]MDT8989596.1 c-type cytochrome [Curvibacter sp. APW13]